MEREKKVLQSKHEEEENKMTMEKERVNHKERKRCGYVCFGFICVLLLAFILQHYPFTKSQEREYHEKLVAKALEAAEAKVPYRSKRARDWGYYIPIVGAAAGGIAGFAEDIVRGIFR